jgi:hypothetical protein
MTGNLAADLTVWDMAQATGNMGLMAAYAGAAYDSSADYWKLVISQDGTRTLLDDQRSSLYVQYDGYNEDKIMDLDEFTQEESLAIILGKINNSNYNKELNGILSNKMPFNDIINLYSDSGGMPPSTEQLNQYKADRLKDALINSLEMQGVNDIIDKIALEGSTQINKLSENAEMRIGLNNIINRIGITDQIFEDVARNVVYTGEKTGYYIDMTVISKAEEKAGPIFTTPRGDLIPDNTDYLTGGLIPNILSDTTYMQMQERSIGKYLLPSGSSDAYKHQDYTLNNLNNTSYGVSNLNGEIIKTSNHMPGGSTAKYNGGPENTASYVDLFAEPVAGTITGIVKSLGKYQINYFNSNQNRYSTLKYRDYFNDKHYVSSLNINPFTEYGRIYKYLNMPDGIAKTLIGMKGALFDEW